MSCCRRVWGCAAILLLAVPSFAPRVQAQSPELEQASMHVAFTRSSFSGVNPVDAEAAFRVLTQALGKKRGYILETTTRIHDRLPDLQADVHGGAVTLLILGAWE